MTMPFSNHAVEFVHLLSKWGKWIPRDTLVGHLHARHILSWPHYVVTAPSPPKDQDQVLLPGSDSFFCWSLGTRSLKDRKQPHLSLWDSCSVLWQKCSASGTRFSNPREPGTVRTGTANSPKRVTRSDGKWGYSFFNPLLPRPLFSTCWARAPYYSCWIGCVLHPGAWCPIIPKMVLQLHLGKAVLSLYQLYSPGDSKVYDRPPRLRDHLPTLLL